jgi:hypothetical protein
MYSIVYCINYGRLCRTPRAICSFSGWIVTFCNASYFITLSVKYRQKGKPMFTYVQVSFENSLYEHAQ